MAAESTLKVRQVLNLVQVAAVVAVPIQLVATVQMASSMPGLHLPELANCNSVDNLCT
jgi:hypothetical protein